MYPLHLAGDAADAPTNPTPADLAAARLEFAAVQLVDGDLYGTPAWRLCGALEQFRAEANAANPLRDRRSDGTIGDAAHAARYSKHNPNAAGVVLASDTDVDGLNLAGAFERARIAARAGRLPALAHGGCLILNHRITAEDFSGWRVYTGPNPHVSHGHADVSPLPALYDDRTPWGVFAPAPSATGWTGPDLAGSGPGLRGDQGDNGPRVQRLQEFLRTHYPLYAKHLAGDGWWGPLTAAVLAEYAHRSEIWSADGANIGPKIAAALHRDGFRG